MMPANIRTILPVCDEIKNRSQQICSCVDELLAKLPHHCAIDRILVKFSGAADAQSVDRKLKGFQKASDNWHGLIHRSSQGSSDLAYDKAASCERIYGSNFNFPSGKNNVAVRVGLPGGIGTSESVVKNTKERNSRLSKITAPGSKSNYRLLCLGDYLPCAFWNTFDDLSKTNEPYYEIHEQIVALVSVFLDLFRNSSALSSDVCAVTLALDGQKITGESEKYPNLDLEAVSRLIDRLHFLLKTTLGRMEALLEEKPPVEILISGSKDDVSITVDGVQVHLPKRQKQGICVLASFRNKPKFSTKEFSQKYSKSKYGAESEQDRMEFQNFVARILRRIPQLRHEPDHAHGRTLLGVKFKVTLSENDLDAYINTDPFQGGKV